MEEIEKLNGSGVTGRGAEAPESYRVVKPDSYGGSTAAPISDAKYPWPSTVNFANYVTVKPSLKNHYENGETDFNIWKEQMHCLVESQEVVGFINGEIVKPNVESEEKLWRRTDRLVKGWILGSIGKDALDLVWNLETARKVWLELDKIFNAHKKKEGGENEGAIRAAITSDLEPALHVAVQTRKANDFFKNLVELMPQDALALKDRDGCTALHKAATVGNTEAAKALVDKYPALPYISNVYDELPVTLAAVSCQEDTLKYLISVSKPKQNERENPFEGKLGVQLLIYIINSELYNVALDLTKGYPNLAGLSLQWRGDCALSCLAQKETAFFSRARESLSWWQKLIYHRISPEQAEIIHEVARDIESNDASARKKHSSSFQIVIRVARKFESIVWKVIQHLIPQVKDIREKKVKHKQALELAKYLCEKMVSLPENKATTMFNHSILRAAEHGISEIVENIIKMYPRSTFATDSNGRNIFHLAVGYRFKNVCNCIYNMNINKYRLLMMADSHGNNIMHACAKLAPQNTLSLVPGVALQMQRELKWFHEMKKFLPPSLQTQVNEENKTPNMILLEEHQELKTQGEKWMKDTANACTIAAALIATVVFAAAFTVPGGLESGTGVPILANLAEYNNLIRKL